MRLTLDPLSPVSFTPLSALHTRRRERQMRSSPRALVERRPHNESRERRGRGAE